MNGKRIWITWETQRRNRSLSQEIGAGLFELLDTRPRIIRYLSLAIRTYKIIKYERPNIVFAQNPSIVLSFLVILFRRLFGYKAIIDEHNSGLFPLEGRSHLLGYIARFIARKADFAIVTNESLAVHVRSIGGTPIVLPDPLPKFESFASEPPLLNGRNRDSLELLFICTWSADEPYLQVIEAAREIQDLPVRLWITGDSKGKVSHLNLPDNVKLTGFLKDTDYVSKLAVSDAVVVLTTREDCLNCGAYEAVSLEKPGILSNTAALRSYFRSGFKFTDADPSSLSSTLRSLYDDWEVLKDEVRGLKHELEQEYKSHIMALEAIT